jgi:perosamine synthetase
VFFWEKIRSLHPLPDQYTERFPNVQAAIGLAALNRLDTWTSQVQANAKYIDQMLGNLKGIQIPAVPADCAHVYYQYCVYGPEGPARDDLVVRCVKRGIDIETLHVDVPPDMPLFAGATAEAAGARRAAQAMQIPIYAGLTREEIQRVGSTVHDVLAEAAR